MLLRVAASLNSVGAFEASDLISALFIWNDGGSRSYSNRRMGVK